MSNAVSCVRRQEPKEPSGPARDAVLPYRRVPQRPPGGSGRAGLIIRKPITKGKHRIGRRLPLLCFRFSAAEGMIRSMNITVFLCWTKQGIYVTILSTAKTAKKTERKTRHESSHRNRLPQRKPQLPPGRRRHPRRDPACLSRRCRTGKALGRRRRGHGGSPDHRDGRRAPDRYRDRPAGREGGGAVRHSGRRPDRDRGDVRRGRHHHGPRREAQSALHHHLRRGRDDPRRDREGLPPLYRGHRRERHQRRRRRHAAGAGLRDAGRRGQTDPLRRAGAGEARQDHRYRAPSAARKAAARSTARRRARRPP